MLTRKQKGKQEQLLNLKINQLLKALQTDWITEGPVPTLGDNSTSDFDCVVFDELLGFDKDRLNFFVCEALKAIMPIDVTEEAERKTKDVNATATRDQ